MQDADTQAKIDRIAAVGPLRAWSVIVTVLGDLCRNRDQAVSAQVLNLLIGPMGITGQAARVAIHRLKRDGWLEAERRGRQSYYRLSATGWKETQAVWQIVYGRTAPDAGGALLIVGPPDIPPGEFSARLPDNAVAIAPRTALLAGQADIAPKDFLSVPIGAGEVPGWVRSLIADAPLLDEYASLTRQVRMAGAEPVPEDLLARASLRLIILHHWRRLCLRHGSLADALLPGDWPGATARAVVFEALEKLARPPIEVLSGWVRETDVAGADNGGA